MSTATYDPANPVKNDGEFYLGLSAREYAAIKLRVPDSGTEWLDAMIRKSLRDELAAKAMQGLLANPKLQPEIMKRGGATGGWIDTSAYGWADAMLEARDDA